MAISNLYKFAVLGSATMPLALGVASVEPNPADNKSSLNKAIAYVVSKGDAWIKERKCVSCHMIPFMVWSLNEAKAVGYAIPSSREIEVMEWSLRDSRRTDPGTEGLGLLVIGRDKTSSDAGIDKTLSEYAGFLSQRQRSDGGWKIGGQMPDQKRPYRETEEVVAMWSALALDEALGDSSAEDVNQVKLFVSTVGERKSTEWTALRMLFAQRFGERGVAHEQLKQMLAMQHKDGGWSWLRGEESDGIATGLGLYALSFFESKEVTKSIDRARSYLFKSQAADGSWSAKSTLAQHRNEVVPTSIYWATTWAVIGLSRTEK